MVSSVDLTQDPLADAALSREERTAWEETRLELARARKKIHMMEMRLSVLENKIADSQVAEAVLNRPDFNREVARMLAFDERYGGTSSVLYFDIENMADLVAAYGQLIAEKMVRKICDSLARDIRRSDILGRLAHDEFGVLLARCANDAAWKKAEGMAGHLFEALKSLPELATPPVISYGAYTFREKDTLPASAQKAAMRLTASAERRSRSEDLEET